MTISGPVMYAKNIIIIIIKNVKIIVTLSRNVANLNYENNNLMTAFSLQLKVIDEVYFQWHI